MSAYYRPIRNPNWSYGGDRFRLTRSKIALFTECPRCFYIDNKLGTGRPPGFPFNLNSAVDALLKKEFDIHRANGTAHPLMERYGVDAVPFAHPKIDIWRENFRGIEYKHPETGFTVSGAVDDVWVNPQGELMIVDYKSTSKDEKIDALDKEWHDGYKQQMEVYQWLFRQNGFKVSDTGYFVYANAGKDKKAFDGILEFDVTLIPHKGDDSWVENTLLSIKQCLSSEDLPESSVECDFCSYYEVRQTNSPISVAEAIKRGETQIIELKTGFSPKEISKTVAAFFNTNTGYIFIGIDPNGVVVGVEANSVTEKERIQNHVYNTLSLIDPASCAHKIEPDFLEYDGKTVVRLTCKKCPSDKLHFVDARAYRRVNTADSVMKATDIERFYTGDLSAD